MKRFLLNGLLLTAFAASASAAFDVGQLMSDLANTRAVAPNSPKSAFLPCSTSRSSPPAK